MSADEMVAWVDENEKLIQVIPLKTANSDPKYLHVEIAGLIVDQDHRVLLQKRSHTKKVAPDVWTVTMAGHVTYGDSIEVTAHKELREEMGIDVPKLIYLFRESVHLPHETHYCHWYLGKYTGGEIVLEPSEVDEYAWVGEADFDSFVSAHDVSDRTIKMCKRFWSGEWDDKLS